MQPRQSLEDIPDLNDASVHLNHRSVSNSLTYQGYLGQQKSSNDS